MKIIKSGSLIVYLPIALAPIILFSPVWLSGNALFWGTPFLQFMPWRELGWAMILKGQLPLWNPYLGMGAPLAANLQTAFYYPPNWLLFAMDSFGGVGLMAQAQTVLVVIHLIFAGIGMAFLARALNLNLLAQAVSGLSFCLSGYLVARAGFLSINAAVAWLPWVILAVNRFIGPFQRGPVLSGIKNHTRDILAVGLCLGLQLLAGHAQTSYFTGLLLAAWVVVWSLVQGKWALLGKNLVKTGLAVLLGACLAGVQLIPTAEFLLQSQRASSVEYEFAMNYSFLPPRVLTLVAQYLFGSPASGNYLVKSDNYWEDALYIGLLPLLLALGAFGGAIGAGVRKRIEIPAAGFSPVNQLSIFLGLAAAAAFVLALGKYTPVFPFLYRYVPSFNMFQGPTRFSLLSEFGLCLLAGIGMSDWQTPRERGLAWTRRGMAAALALLIGSGAGLIVLHGVAATLVEGVALAGVTGLLCGAAALSLPAAQTGRGFTRWSWAVVVFIGADLLGMGWGLNPGAAPALYQAPSSALGALSPRLGSHRLYLSTADETDLQYNRFLTFNNFTIKEPWQNLRNTLLPDGNVLDRVPSVNNFDPVLPARYTRWISAVDSAGPGVRAGLLALMDVGVVESVDRSQPLGVKFTPQTGAARFRWMGCAQAAVDGPDALVKVLNQLAVPSQRFDDQVVLETASVDDQAGCDKLTPARLSLTGEDPNRVDLAASGSSAGWLMLSDSWYPGWTALIDGKPVPVYRADYLFRAVRLPPGNHQISFIYQPASFFAGLFLSVLAFLVILGLQFVSRRTKSEV